MSNENKKPVAELSCPKCLHFWKYKGKSSIYVTCPHCHYSINIQNMKGGQVK